MDDRVVLVGCPQSDRRCGGRQGAGRPRGRRTPGLARRWLWRNAPQKPPGPVFAGWSYGWPSPRGGAARSASECTPRAPSGRRGVVGGREQGAGLRDVGRPLPEVPAKPPSVSRSWIRGTHVSGRASRRPRASRARSVPRLPARPPEVPAMPLSPPGPRNSTGRFSPSWRRHEEEGSTETPRETQGDPHGDPTMGRLTDRHVTAGVSFRRGPRDQSTCLIPPSFPPPVSAFRASSSPARTVFSVEVVTMPSSKRGTDLRRD